jgi:hypothetical protein
MTLLEGCYREFDLIGNRSFSAAARSADGPAAHEVRAAEGRGRGGGERSPGRYRMPIPYECAGS